MIVLFLDRCTPVNITTSDVFRDERNNTSQSFSGPMIYDGYEIVPIQGGLPILYDTIDNIFYVQNGKGLIKIDSRGKILLSDSLAHEEITSALNMYNYLPFVFTSKGVYDFSTEQVTFQNIAKDHNKNNELSDATFKTLFEGLYADAEMVVYENDNLGDRVERYPMYFYINDQWEVLYAQAGEYRFSHLNYGDLEETIVGQIDFKNFPAKFNGRKLVVLKDYKQKVYTTGRDPKDDDFFDTYYAVILRERELDYQTGNSLEITSYKKIDYHFTGSYFELPRWVNPSFSVNAYYKLSFYGEDFHFNSSSYKYRGYGGAVKDNINLFQAPKTNKDMPKIAFLLEKYDGFQLKMIRPK